MKFILRLIAIFALLASSGCVSNVPMDITQSGRASILPGDLQLSKVRITVKLATFEDLVGQMGSTFNVHSGKIYRQVFTGDEDAPASLDLINSSMTQSMNDVMIFATKSNVTYSATVLLTIGDKKQIITSTATAATAWTLDRAAREAVERVVIDIAKQCEVYLAQELGLAENL
jgi:hypothetical protein